MARIKTVHDLRIIDMMRTPEIYEGLPEGLVMLPIPDLLTIEKKMLTVPEDLKAFSESICYGQRLYMAREEPNDFGLILRNIAGYYYTIYSGKAWNENEALSFGRNVLYCKAKEAYPVATHIVNLMGELSEQENTLLYRKPSKQELAAGIEKLSVFSDLTSLIFLQESFRITEEEVMQKPYNDCLVRFMMQKEQNQFAEKLAEIYRNQKTTT